MLGVSLVLLMAMRLLVGPAFATVAPGLIALCAGTEIVWVQADGSIPADQTREPCPWLGLSAAPAQPPTPLPLRRLAPVPTRGATLPQALDTPAPRYPPQAPRAPPMAEIA
ncbi:hypothetical protein M1105_18370 [Limibaculum sp. FT325]|uniref:hypothetical protein n=1 Tax=Thermohalobaculum sediminis TaxID=2939436 RepID=UPI0020C12053|nr:hypothetical protein [Limibaculum sediminis]MCL5778942.1 hypothetical protein [Limibaculum sediminis]